VDEVPTLSYSPSTLVLTINTSSTDLPLNATLTGSGTITSWAISPALPSGLSFGTSNGTIWGTPTSLMTLKTFTIWANNSGGSSFATVNITVNDEIPDISYSPDWFVLTNNTAMSPTATPTNSGGAIPSGIIDSNGNVGEYTSIAIDSNGFKHISYYGGGDLKYATDTSGSWVVTTVDTSARRESTSIAIDSNDAVHISYQGSGNLKYATCSSSCATASNWDLVSVDTTSTNVGEYGSIAIDSNDTIHISYFDNGNNDLKYATCSNGCTSASNWTNVSVYTTGVVGMFTSIAIDSNDALHVAFWNRTSGHTGFLRYATCSSDCTNTSNWNDVYIATYISGYGFTSLAIDSNDAVHISYRGINPQLPTVYTNLNYATCSSGCTTASNWDVVSVDTASYPTAYTSLAIDSNDAVHISYGDNNINGGLRYATCSSGCTSGSNWNKVGLDATADYLGYYNSIAIDANDAVHIAYRDHTNGDLKYIALDASSNVYGYSISPDLPAGLSFNTSSGEISGTPTGLSTNTTYTITARNSGGTNTTTITIEVIDQVPTLSYSPENLTLTKGQSSSDLPLNATVTGSGTITSWAINATLPAGLNFGTSNGTIWGIPTVLQTTAVTYTIWANNSGGSTSATINITINDEAPGPFEYIPENNTWTNNSYVNIGPSFINQTSGNGSRWAVSLPNSNLAMVVGDVVYLNGNNFFGDARFAALNTSNGTAWYPNPTWYAENGSVLGGSTYNHGYHMAYLIGDIIYFDASGEFFAYNTSNNSGWLVKEINTNTTCSNCPSNPGSLFSTLMGDTIYFSASSGNASLGVELWAHNTSNGTTWRVGHTNTTGTLPSTNSFTSYGRDLGVIDDTIYFQAWGSGDEGLWAYNTSNTTMWQIDFRSTSRSANPGMCMAVVVGDSLYF
ncbi:MAG: putative Ig domain-containing protein, partial [Candidatus Poseidoniaceae archaeon]